MYIFNRVTTTDRHHQLEAMEGAVEIAGIVSGISGLDVSVFISRYGEPTNTLMWSCRADSQAQMHDAMEKLGTNDDYIKWVTSHSELFETAPTDHLAEVVSGSNPSPAPRRFYNVLTAVAANGRFAEAMAFGVKAEQFVGKVTGLSTSFLSPLYGTFGGVVWLTGADTMAELDSVRQMETTNTDYHALLAEAGPLFAAGTAMAGLIEKIN